MKYDISFAPIQGYTEDVYRRLHNKIFGGVSTYYSPFVRLEHGEIRSKDIRDIRNDFNEGINLVPQVIANGGEELTVVLDQITQFGYKRIDINMGCPFPLQTRHGRGAGLLPNQSSIEEIAKVIENNINISFSVKLRLGLSDSHECLNAISILNNIPLQHITIHPRLATQQYRGDIDFDTFESCLEICKHKVLYNGDITTIEQIDTLNKKYGDRVAGIMIGRGLLARPSLANEYYSDSILSERQLLEKVIFMHDCLHEHYSMRIPGESQQLAKLKTYWDYFQNTIGRKAWKKIIKAGNMKNYHAAIESLKN